MTRWTGYPTTYIVERSRNIHNLLENEMVERKLGRGLDSLLGDVRATAGEEVIELPIEQLKSGAFQPRTDFDEVRLAEAYRAPRHRLHRGGPAGRSRLPAGRRTARRSSRCSSATPRRG